MARLPPRDPVNDLTGELRLGRSIWTGIRPHLTRYIVPGGVLFDWAEVMRVVAKHARAERHPEVRDARV